VALMAPDASVVSPLTYSRALITIWNLAERARSTWEAASGAGTRPSVYNMPMAGDFCD